MNPPNPASPAPFEPRQQKKPLRRWILSHRSFAAGMALLLMIASLALLAPLLSPHDPCRQDLANRMAGPAWQEDGTWLHPLGTDNLGRDCLSRLLHGARISLLVGGATMVIAALIGAPLGILAGYFGGRTDMAISFLITLRLSMPVALVALAFAALSGGSLTAVIWVLGLLLWDRFAVVMRAATQQVRSADYITAARALGCSTRRILLSAVLPNVLNSLIVVAALEFAHAILLEAALSFLGLGVQPPLPSWGLMISEGKAFMLFTPRFIAVPGFALLLLVLAVTLAAEGLRRFTAPEGRSL